MDGPWMKSSQIAGESDLSLSLKTTARRSMQSTKNPTQIGALAVEDYGYPGSTSSLRPSLLGWTNPQGLAKLV